MTPPVRTSKSDHLRTCRIQLKLQDCMEEGADAHSIAFQKLHNAKQMSVTSMPMFVTITYLSNQTSMSVRVLSNPELCI